MALPSTGAISLSQVLTELGRTGAISLNDGTVRSLAGKASGIISMADLRGKSAALVVTPKQFSTGTATFRGYSKGHDGLGTGPSAAGGSLSTAIYQGVMIQAIGAYSNSQNKLYIETNNLDKPTVTKISINGGTAITISWTLFKVAYRAEITITGIYATAASTFTVVFS